MSDSPTPATPLMALAEEPVLTHVIASHLLRTASQGITEEDRHPWNRGSKPEKPLLRVWDYFSGSNPKQTNRMLSRSQHGRLDTFENRKDSLTTHADHKNWTPTPFISFTTSAEAVQKLADARSARRGTQRLTIVNPNVRSAKCLPILDMGNEMNHYSVSNPYGESDQYYRNHYLCPWEVTPAEVVGNWRWDELVSNANWYHEIIMPEFERHNERFFAKQVNGEALDLKDVFNALPSTSLTSERPRRAPLGREEVNDSSDSAISYSTDCDTSSEESTPYFENEFDWHDATDDEAEEANATDDYVRIIEGDW